MEKRFCKQFSESFPCLGIREAAVQLLTAECISVASRVIQADKSLWGVPISNIIKKREHNKILFVLSHYILQVFNTEQKQHQINNFNNALSSSLEFPFLSQCYVTTSQCRWLVGACMWIVASQVANAGSLSATVTSAPASGRVRETPLLLAWLFGDGPALSRKSGNSVHFLKNHIDREKLRIEAAVIE